MCTFRTGEACTCTAAISSGPRTRRQSRRRLCIPSTAPTPRRSSDKTKRETRRTVHTRPASALCFNTHTRSHTHTHVFIAESVHTHKKHTLTYSYTHVFFAESVDTHTYIRLHTLHDVQKVWLRWASNCPRRNANAQSKSFGHRRTSEHRPRKCGWRQRPAGASVLLLPDGKIRGCTRGKFASKKSSPAHMQQELSHTHTHTRNLQAFRTLWMLARHLVQRLFVYVFC